MYCKYQSESQFKDESSTDIEYLQQQYDLKQVRKHHSRRHILPRNSSTRDNLTSKTTTQYETETYGTQDGNNRTNGAFNRRRPSGRDSDYDCNMTASMGQNAIHKNLLLTDKENRMCDSRLNLRSHDEQISDDGVRFSKDFSLADSKFRN